MPKKQNYNDQTARLYSDYALNGLRYQKVAQVLIDTAGNIHGQSVLDLGCGTGLLTNMLARAVGPDGEVTGVDASLDMIMEAKNNVTLPNVKFVHSRIEEMDSLIGSRVDAVFSNAAFWQFDQTDTLAVLRRLLKPNGRLYFNLSGGFFDFKHSQLDDHRHENWPYVQSDVLRNWIMRAHELHPHKVAVPTPIPNRKRTAQQIVNEFSSAGLSVVDIKPLIFEIPRNDELQWMKIPQWTEQSLTGISYQERVAILEDIFATIPPDATFIGKWAIITAQRM